MQKSVRQIFFALCVLACQSRTPVTAGSTNSGADSNKVLACERETLADRTWEQECLLQFSESDPEFTKASKVCVDELNRRLRSVSNALINQGIGDVIFHDDLPDAEDRMRKLREPFDVKHHGDDIGVKFSCVATSRLLTKTDVYNRGPVMQESWDGNILVHIGNSHEHYVCCRNAKNCCAARLARTPSKSEPFIRKLVNPGMDGGHFYFYAFRFTRGDQK